jgi:hypothetical protein
MHFLRQSVAVFSYNSTPPENFRHPFAVRETLQFAQALRKNAHAPIDGILKTLNLTKVADTIVGSPLKVTIPQHN